jgi:hypothetical protein
MTTDHQTFPRQSDSPGPGSAEILLSAAVCSGFAVLSIILGAVFSSPGNASPLLTSLAPAMTMVAMLGGATYRVVRGLERRLARLENRQDGEGPLA